MKLRLESLAVASVFAMLFTSCSSDNVKISGKFHGKGGSMLYFEKLSPKKAIVDSVELGSNGEFCYKFDTFKDMPKFLNLKLSDSFITLLVNRGEDIEINSIYGIPGGYEVKGSEGSQLVKELNKSMLASSNKIDSLYLDFNAASDVEERNVIANEIATVYVAQKKNNIKFLIEHSNSLASILALYQKMPNGVELFNDNADILYFKMVADSLKSKYPNSLHIKTLERDIQNFQNRTDLQNMINTSITSSFDIAFPEIEMKDIYGDTQKLSELSGKVILLSFYSTQDRNSSMQNSEYKEIYNVYKDRGFEIFQVSLDSSKPQWVESVTNQKLPWISVNDLQGVNSTAIRKYNVTSLPSNFLISRKGDIIGKNLYGADLANKIAELF